MKQEHQDAHIDKLVRQGIDGRVGINAVVWTRPGNLAGLKLKFEVAVPDFSANPMSTSDEVISRVPYAALS